MVRISVLISLILAGVGAHARVFNFKDSSLAAYVRTTGGLSSLGQTPFKESAGTDITVDGSTKFDYSGELGFMVGIGSDVHVRLGAELIQHRPVSDAAAVDLSGTQMYTLNSSVSAFNPNFTIEFVFGSKGNMRFYGAAGAGLADVTVENKYTMTSSGTSTFGVTDYNELMTGASTSYHVGVGMETLFVDNVTLALDIGYRHLPVTSLKYKGDANTILVPGGVLKGDPVLNSDGSKRSLNLGGLTVGIAFRFYLKFI